MNKQTECKECGGEGELPCEGDSHYIDTMSSHDCFNPTCEECDGTGKQEYSDEDTKGGTCSKCGQWKGGNYGMNSKGEQTMEERFDKEMIVAVNNRGKHFFLESKVCTPKNIISFIKKEIQQARQERDSEIYNKTLEVMDNFGLIETNQLLSIFQGDEVKKINWGENLRQEEREKAKKKGLRLYDENYNHGEQKDGSTTFITEKEFDSIIKAINQETL